MSDKRKSNYFKILIKVFVVLVCLGGFLYQTLQFLFLYWTYPTVVDIQEISPSYLKMPAFTICNSIGYNIDFICNGVENSFCTAGKLNESTNNYVCSKYPEACIEDKVPEDFVYVAYARFMHHVSIGPEDHEHLRMHLEEYMTCAIEFAGSSKKCNMENVMGSFFSKDDLPQYCYTIYSLWGQPQKKREFIQKGAMMKLHFFLNASRREVSDPSDIPLPRYNLPAELAVQIAVHSPYFLPSPYVDGMTFLKGRAYEMRLTMKETHLLPAPYQTNCTDYMKIWRQRGGKSAVNQLGIVQECRVKKANETLGCIPLTFDFPHSYRICRSCPGECDYNVSTDECSLLADNYNQPCDSITYSATKENKMLTFFEKLNTNFIKTTEGVGFRILSHECSGRNFWKRECSSIDINVLFDKFQITKLTYNPKFESLELFSVLGGYMGMWLGVSLITVYDFMGTFFSLSIAALKKKRSLRRKKPRNLEGFEDAPQLTVFRSCHM